MKIVAQGSTTIAASNTPQRLIPDASWPTTNSPVAHVWVGAGDSNAADARVGLSGTHGTLPHLVAAADQKGFTINHDSPATLFVDGTADDVVRWALYA